MPFITPRIVVQELSPGMWQLVEPLVYQGNSQQFVVPKGFETDFASVPKLFTWLVPPYGLYTKAAVLHDFLLHDKPVSDSDADGIFRRAMRELGVSFLRRWIMWAAVRLHSKLSQASWREVALVIIIGIPTVLYLIIPFVVVLIALVIFYVFEYIIFAGIQLRGQKKANEPSLLLGADAVEENKK